MYASYEDRDEALRKARSEAMRYGTIIVMVQSESTIWFVIPYHDFVPQSEGWDGATLRCILPKGEVTKLS